MILRGSTFKDRSVIPAVSNSDDLILVRLGTGVELRMTTEQAMAFMADLIGVVQLQLTLMRQKV